MTTQFTSTDWRAGVRTRGSRLAALMLAIPAAAAMLLAGCSTPAANYTTPDAAVGALIGALRPLDEQKVRTVFGSDGEEIISSGDPVADRDNVADFVAAYEAGHRLVENEDGSRTLELGKENWPFPVPIVHQGNGWAFDCAAGKEEILNRRIGENELSTIEACLALVDAQREYAMRDPDKNGMQEYAEKFISDPGKRNGLYWPVAPGEAQSPVGALVAEATEEGYALGSASKGRRAPFHGYYFRRLSAQGPDAVGGARDFVINGHQIGGFACVASPAEYGNSGVMTFIVNQEGVVYQKDLGSGTDREAQAMKTFNPGAGWVKIASVSEEMPKSR